MATRSPSAAENQDIATPQGAGGLLPALLQGQRLPALLARVGAWLASIWGRPFKIGPWVIAARHADVSEMLARDLDFLIAPINAARIEAVNGPFVLGMDRGARLAVEHGALYAALRAVDKTKIRAEVVRVAAEAIARAGAGSLDVVGDYARPIAARTATALFGISGSDEHLFMDVARAIFAHTFLNIGGDKAIEARALKAAALMRAWFEDEIARRRASGELGHDMMGALMSQRALDDDGVRRTLGGMLVGSIDTTASAVAKIVKTLGRDSDLRARMILDLDNPARMEGWCAEALRRWPHNPAMLRSAAAATQLGTTPVKAGATVVAWTQAAMLDPSAFPEPALLTPERPRSAYLHFGGALHHCAGRSINEFQIPILVGGLLARGIDRVGRVQWAGPFPDRLDVDFTGQPQ
ncbi:MAG TPA: cytochrome P450 [Burkholderiales bacterium]|nr:cytochrome P450 [Burkholderiales bacterium]